MVDLLWLAHDEACEVELAGLIAGVLDEGLLTEARALKPMLVPRRRELPGDTPVTLTDLASFDALLWRAGHGDSYRRRAAASRQSPEAVAPPIVSSDNISDKLEEETAQ
ncbi:hypothetical protein PVT71_28575 (plasmid) [Salipiger sp. H15]|uniref:Uncharacterized protein n=1 Tax=Alloyangia sp. H15 TaxID=3029062 RepID=A0AAU8ASE7_9RHOB